MIELNVSTNNYKTSASLIMNSFYLFMYFLLLEMSMPNSSRIRLHKFRSYFKKALLWNVRLLSKKSRISNQKKKDQTLNNFEFELIRSSF